MRPACCTAWERVTPKALRASRRSWRRPEFVELEWRDAPLAGHDDLGRVHPPGYVQALLAAVPDEGLLHVDPDTAMGPDTGQAVLRAAGAVIAAVDAVVTGEAQNAFCAVRPPGHHAEPSRPMGFCFLNNAAVGALHARARHGLQRIAVVDFDVHHGNGTQRIFERDPQLFYASTHQSPAYPGTGSAEERGISGNIVNVPLPPGADGGVFRAAYEKTILPALDAFAPDLVVISAGFDAHHADPLAALALNEDDYAWVTNALCGVARSHSRGRTVSVLEGGYDLDALARSVAAHVRALMQAANSPPP
jgi:acetoin utilization deacetylase AcuC-like enzyme